MDVIAHRGASGYEPEHTFAAYDLALEQGADMLELDVRATRDGTLVVLHDATTRRIAREPLTLDAVLGRYGDRTRWLVELKDPDPSWELGAVAALRRHGLLEHAVVQSFDSAAMRRLRVAIPELAVAPLWRRPPSRRRLDRMARYATAIGVWHGVLEAGLVGAAHARGLEVRAWTVNDAAAIARVCALGVDGVITDFPDTVRLAATAATLPAVAA